MLASRLDRFAPSTILALVQRARSLAAEGRDIIDLGIGEPDFQTPDHVIEAAHAAMQRGETKYTVINGTTRLRESIRDKFRRENQLDYALDEIAVSGGAKQIVFNAIMATVDPGDEVIIPAPYWASYPDIVKFAQGVVVEVPCPAEDGFRLTPEALEAALTPRTRWLVLNSPSNPTGAAYSADDLAALADVLERHPQVLVMSDDIYEHLIYDNHVFATIASVRPSLKDRTLTINGVSKAYAMTGWRLGYAGGPKALIGGMSKLQGQSTSSASSVSQAATVAALEGPQELLGERAEAFRRRRNLVVELINGIDGLSCHPPEGAFYLYPGCAPLIGRRTPDGATLDDDTALCAYLLEHAGVSMVPGAAFGQSPFFRLSYATSEAQLRDALGRMKAAIGALA